MGEAYWAFVGIDADENYLVYLKMILDVHISLGAEPLPYFVLHMLNLALPFYE